MPKIAPHYFSVRLGEYQDENFNYKADVSVSSKGEFRISIPPEVIPAAIALAKKEPRVTIEKGKVHTSAVCFDKTLGTKLIEDAVRDYCQAEHKTELIIVYAHDSEGRYVVGPNGEVAPDIEAIKNFGRGHWSEQVKEGWRWSSEQHQHFGCHDTMKFGIGAKVYEKTTITRATGVTVKYDVYWGKSGDHFDRTEWCQRLNAFDIHFGLSNRLHEGAQRENEIPYTEEGARFFFEAMIALCSLNERIKSFFADPVKLAKQIETNSARLLPGGSNEPRI